MSIGKCRHDAKSIRWLSGIASGYLYVSVYKQENGNMGIIDPKAFS